MAMANFEVAVFNQEVRDLVQNGQSHRDFTDDWADIHLIEISAPDVATALSKIRSRYPETRGFVINGVHEADGL